MPRSEHGYAGELPPPNLGARAQRRPRHEHPRTEQRPREHRAGGHDRLRRERPPQRSGRQQPYRRRNEGVGERHQHPPPPGRPARLGPQVAAQPNPRDLRHQRPGHRRGAYHDRCGDPQNRIRPAAGPSAIPRGGAQPRPSTALAWPAGRREPPRSTTGAQARGSGGGASPRAPRSTGPASTEERRSSVRERDGRLVKPRPTGGGRVAPPPRSRNPRDPGSNPLGDGEEQPGERPGKQRRRPGQHEDPG